MFFPDWYKKGILIIADIIDADCRMLSLRELKAKFNTNMNVLNYYTVKAKISLYLEKIIPEKNWNVKRPLYPKHLDVIIKSRKGCRNLYDNFNNATSACHKPLSEIIWDNLVQNENSEKPLKEKWNTIYEICFFTTLDNNTIWFQYRILNKILGTKEYLKKLKISTNSICSFCNIGEEDLNHLLHRCREVTNLWENVQQWIQRKIGIDIKLTPTLKIRIYSKR